MNAAPLSTLTTDIAAPRTAIEPSILYFGTPVVLLSTENPDGSSNLAPISSAWALDRTVVLGLGRELGHSCRTQTAAQTEQ